MGITYQASALKLHLKLFLKGRLVLNTRPRSRRQFIQKAKANNFDLAYLKVSYKPKVWNGGEYINAEDLISALYQFTEKSLLEFIQNTSW